MIRSPLTRGSAWASSLLPALAFTYAGYLRRWAGDDGFINLRVVSQLLDGNGFVFNAGERCEAVTSPGWVLVLWLLGELGCDIESAAWITALFCSFAGVALAALGSARLAERAEGEGRALTLPFGVLVYAALPVAWDYATSALENGIGLAYFGGVYFAMARLVCEPPTRWRPYWVAALVGLAPMMRPDYALYALPLGLLAVLSVSSWRERGLTALAGILPAGGFQIFRMGYYAALVPNTALAKEAFEARWEQGQLYLANTFGSYQLWAPLCVVALLTLALCAVLLRERAWMRAALPLSLAITGALHLLYVVRLGGDFMHGRMLLPGIFAICTAGATVRIALPKRDAFKPDLPQLLSGASLAALLFVAYWTWNCASNLRVPIYENQILDERRYWSEAATNPNPTFLDAYQNHDFYRNTNHFKARIAAGCPAGLASLADDIGDICKRVAMYDAMDGRLSDDPDDPDFFPLATRGVPPQVVAVFAFRPLGISGRLMGLRINVVDSFGLADPLASRMELHQRGRPGHEKTFPTVWFAAKHINGTADIGVALAKRALGCGPLKKLQEATRGELTVTRFFKNIGVAYELHKLRVPADPAAAISRFCRN